MRGKKIRWGMSHSDKYVYHQTSETWVKFDCSLSILDVVCQGYNHIPVSEIQDYSPVSFEMSEKDEYLAEVAIEKYENTLERKR